MPSKGKLITFEGGEGAGKSTLISRLLLELKAQGHDVLGTRAPGGTPLGQEIRRLLLETRDIPIAHRAELLLFLADRAEHVEHLIRPALEQGKIVLCDRFDDSTVAYQGCARSFGEENVRTLCAFATGGLKPDATIYLDIAPEVGFQRMRHAAMDKDRIESENMDFHKRIRDAFRGFAAKEPKRIHVIDASMTPDEVFQNVYERLQPLFLSHR
jgi:dTMP kinase